MNDTKLNNQKKSSKNNVATPAASGSAASGETSRFLTCQDRDALFESWTTTDEYIPSHPSFQWPTISSSHNTGASSGESSNPGSVAYLNWQLKSNDVTSELKESLIYIAKHGSFQCSTESNTHETGVSSGESSNPGSVASLNWPPKFHEATSELDEYLLLPSPSMDSSERNINERNISSVESSNPGSVLSPSWTADIAEIAKSLFEREFQKTQKYKDMLQKNFIKIKNNIDISSMTKKAVEAHLVRKEAVSWINSKKRSKRADLLLTKIIQNIELKDIPKFEEIISKPIAEQIKKGSNKCSTLQGFKIDMLGKKLYSSTLKCYRAVLIDNLQPDDIEDLKDLFIEKSIIDIDENEDVIRHPGFVMKRSHEFVSYFVDKYIINKASAGSHDCLVQFLRENRNERLKHILSSLKPESIENMGNVESGLEVNRTLTVDQIDSEVNVTEIDEKNFEISLKFEQNDQQTDKACKRVVSTVKSKNHIIASSFEGIITDSEKGSVIIHLTSLHKYTLQRIINSISNEQFSKVLELLFKDDEVKRILTPGNYKLKMAVRICEDKQILNEKPLRSTELTQNIADNRSFLIEEIDTLIVLERFRSQEINVEPGIERKDRDTRARYIIDLAMSNVTAAKSFYSTLDDMPHVEERLTTYERVYRTDPILVCKHILNKFSNISETVDLADVRIVFVERKIFEDKQLDSIEKDFHHDRRDVMAVFLTEVIKNGNDAMLTLVDALFVISLDALAESLISDVTDVFEETTVEKESTNTVVQMKGQAFEEVLIASATFILRIAKGEENKSIVTTSKDLNISNSRKVMPMYDRGNLQADAIMQLEMSKVTSSKEQESNSLADRTVGKRHQVSYVDTSNPAKMFKHSGSRSWPKSFLHSLTYTEDFRTVAESSYHKPLRRDSSYKLKNEQFEVTVPNTLRHYQPETQHDTEDFRTVAELSYHKPLRRDSSYKLKNEQFEFTVPNTLRHYQPETQYGSSNIGWNDDLFKRPAMYASVSNASRTNSAPQLLYEYTSIPSHAYREGINMHFEKTEQQNPTQSVIQENTNAGQSPMLLENEEFDRFIRSLTDGCPAVSGTSWDSATSVITHRSIPLNDESHDANSMSIDSAHPLHTAFSDTSIKLPQPVYVDENLYSARHLNYLTYENSGRNFNECCSPASGASSKSTSPNVLQQSIQNNDGVNQRHYMLNEMTQSSTLLQNDHPLVAPLSIYYKNHAFS